MRERPWRRRLALVAASTLIAPALGTTPALAQDDPDPLAPIADALDDVLSNVTGSDEVSVLVHGTDVAAADDAIAEAGMQRLVSFDKIGVVAAEGMAADVEQLRSADGVTYVEHNEPVEFFQTSGTEATRALEAQQTLTGPDGEPIDGSGTSVAVIDTGVDPHHPAFADENGDSRVVANMRSLCLTDSPDTGCIIDAGPLDTDTTSLGGHGTHVTGIAAGQNYELADGSHVGGSAPGADIVSVATGAVVLIVGTNAAMNWVLENHEAPCGEDVPAEECAPIKVINNSWGPAGGGQFDEESATVKLQRALAEEGVMTVWANGNDGGDGSQSLSNPPGQDPTPGIMSVASYYDEGTATRDGSVSDFSSRGDAENSHTWPDISAPGESVLSACRLTMPICSTGLDFRHGPGLLDLGTYNVISGTSMAAPQVAGIAAQLFQAAPEATPGEVEHAMKATAHKYTDGAEYVDIGDYTSSFDKGTGLVDAVAAVEYLTE
ncbi:S8 family peptidase [Haloechinothrix sp. LS1_15]|uniref:S8 family peptidase n=1 Tax=Haloechinothrix sp. LS1_15 TaxID=2652248 RepID=UPI0029466974|nr:S8 family peptidase [Haloechinothrix sp. LS1_15]MDV6012759.1 S8 family peptidase [Haloechinothrix sp. LS1_15]